MRVLRILTPVLCLALLAGCAQQVPGQALPVDAAQQQQDSSGSAGNGDSNGPLPSSDLRIAHPRSAGICSLLDRDALQKRGQIEMMGSLGFSGCDFALSYCVLDQVRELPEKERKKQTSPEQEKCLDRVTDPVSGVVDFELSLEDTSLLPKRKALQPEVDVDPVPVNQLREVTMSGHTVLKFPKASRQCSYAVPLHQQAVLMLYVAPRNSSTDGNDLCALAKDVMGTAVKKIASGDVDKMDRPANSLAFVDLCSTIQSEDVAISAVEWSKKYSDDFGRTCIWMAKKHGAPVAKLTVDSSPGLIPAKKRGAKGPDDFVGRPTWTTPGVGEKSYLPAGFCVVTTTHLRDSDVTPEGYAELVEVQYGNTVNSKATEPVACGPTKKIAKSVWPKLPH